MPKWQECLLQPWDLDLDFLSEKQDEDSLLLWGDHLSFECDLLDLFKCDEDPWDMECESLLDCDRCLHLDLDRLHQSFFHFRVWDLDRDFESLSLEWGGDQDLCFFLRGGGGGSSFIFPFEGTFFSSEDSL